MLIIANIWWLWTKDAWEFFVLFLQFFQRFEILSKPKVKKKHQANLNPSFSFWDKMFAKDISIKDYYPKQMKTS
jgi:hypothetical protein